MNKRAYIAPEVHCMEVMAEHILATSMELTSDTVDTEDGFSAREDNQWRDAPPSVMDDLW